jgi:hypothetical protein
MASLDPINTAPPYAAVCSSRQAERSTACLALQTFTPNGNIRKIAREHTSHLRRGRADCSAGDNNQGKRQMQLFEDVRFVDAEICGHARDPARCALFDAL